MFSRRRFMVTSVVAAVSTSAHSLVPVGVNGVKAALPNGPGSTGKISTALNFENVNTLKQSWLRLANESRAFDAKIVDVHDMNCDERLEQFVVELKADDSSADLSGIYKAFHQSEDYLRSVPISIERSSDWENNGRYVAVYSRFRAA